MSSLTPEDAQNNSIEKGIITQVSLYDWEGSLVGNRSEIESQIYGDITARRVDGSLGWLVLNDFVTGIENSDAERLAWARSRFIYLIHQSVGKIGSYGANEESKRVALPADFIRQSGYAPLEAQLQTAEGILEKLKNVQHPESFEDFNFGTATLGERFRIRRQENNIELSLSCGNSSEQKYFEVMGYYLSLCRLMDIKDRDLYSAKPAGSFKQESESSNIEISFDKDKFSMIKINLPINKNKK